jgi:hypothetical protein
MTKSVSTQFQLPIAALPLLANPALTPSAISPLRLWINTSDLTGGLKESGTWEYGQLQPPLRILADRLTQTHFVTVLRYQAGGNPLIWLACFDHSNTKPISIYLAGENALIETPVDIEAILTALGEMIGTSALRNSDLDVLIETEDVYGWLSLVDARRIIKLEAMLGHDANPMEIAPLLSTPALRGQRFRDLIPSVDTVLANSHLTLELTRLQQKGLAQRNGESWLLSDGAERCLDRLLIIDGVITLQSLRIIDGEQLGSSTIVYIQGGVNDFLAMESVSEGLRIWAESSMGVLVQTRLLMENGEVIPWTSAPQSEPTQNKTAPQLVYCSACHQPLRDGDKFCTHCGAPVTIMEPPKPQTCPQCGHTPTPGAKFCGNCGFVLGAKS